MTGFRRYYFLGFTLDVFQRANGKWIADFWHPLYVKTTHQSLERNTTDAAATAAYAEIRVMSPAEYAK